MRDETFDIVKGLAIILMVLGHAGCPESLRGFIYLFHIPVFFLAAGWFYRRPDDARDVGRSVLKKLARLWWPYCFWATAWILLHNFLLEIGIYATGHYQDTVYARQGLFSVWSGGEILRRCLTVPLMSGGATGLGAPYWFLSALLVGTILYTLSDFALTRLGRYRTAALTLVALAFALAGLYWHRKPMRVLEGFFPLVRPTLTAFLLVHVGVLLRCADFRLGRLRMRTVGFVGAACLALLLVLSLYGSVELVMNDYPGVPFLVLTSVAGWYLLQSVAVLGGAGLRPLAYAGRYSLSILLLHLLAFKLLTLAVIAFRGDDWILLARPIIAYEGGAWWLAYLVAGVLIPLVLNELWWRAWRRVTRIVAKLKLAKPAGRGPH